MPIGALPLTWNAQQKAPPGLRPGRDRPIFNACLGLWLARENGGGFLYDEAERADLKIVTAGTVTWTREQRGPALVGTAATGGYFQYNTPAWAWKLPLTFAILMRPTAASQYGLIHRDYVSFNADFAVGSGYLALQLDLGGGQTSDNVTDVVLNSTDYVLAGVRIAGTNQTCTTCRFFAVRPGGVLATSGGGAGGGGNNFDSTTLSQFTGSGATGYRLMGNGGPNPVHANVVLGGMWNRILSDDELVRLYLDPHREIF